MEPSMHLTQSLHGPTMMLVMQTPGMNHSAVRVRLKYISEDVDRHGNVRCYFRRPGQPKIRLRSMPGTPEFFVEYQAALTQPNGTGEAPVRSREIRRGTFRHLCVQYFASGEYSALDGSTKNWQRRALEKVCETHGESLVSHMQARHVRVLRDELLATPAAANQRLKALRALFSWANETEETGVNPVLGVKRIRYASEGHHTWTDDEIMQYQKRHPVGTKARLAFDLLRFIAFRREDVVRIGPDHFRNGRVQYRQAKNEHRNPIDIDIPLHPELEASIAATVTGTKTFLLTGFGKAFTANGFGGKFKDWCRQADLPHCSAHGIRKATATALAENGATAHEIMSITGHRSLKEAERYTRDARGRKMADSAMAKLSPQAEATPNPERNLSHRNIKRDNSRKKTKENKRGTQAWRSLGALADNFTSKIHNNFNASGNTFSSVLDAMLDVLKPGLFTSRSGLKCSYEQSYWLSFFFLPRCKIPPRDEKLCPAAGSDQSICL